MNLRRLQEKIREICEDSDLAMVGVFGSVARNEDGPDSDIDLIVRFKNPVGLLEIIRLEDRFAHSLGRRVDLGTEASLHPLIRNNVLKEMKVLYKD